MCFILLIFPRFTMLIPFFLLMLSIMLTIMLSIMLSIMFIMMIMLKMTSLSSFFMLGSWFFSWCSGRSYCCSFKSKLVLVLIYLISFIRLDTSIVKRTKTSTIASKKLIWFFHVDWSSIRLVNSAPASPLFTRFKCLHIIWVIFHKSLFILVLNFLRFIWVLIVVSV